MSTKYHVGQDRNEDFRISIRYYVAPLTSFWLLSPKQAPGPSSVEIDLGGSVCLVGNGLVLNHFAGSPLQGVLIASVAVSPTRAQSAGR
jgi:hypothetical protein